MARYIGPRIIDFTHEKLENWLDLEINQNKTRVLKLCEERTFLDFLGFTFRLDESLKKGWPKYWNVFPSKKSMARERAKLKAMTSSKVCFLPVTEIVKNVNTHLIGWSNYFKYGHPRKAFRQINGYICKRLTRHLKRRSQRPMKPPEGVSYYEYFKRLGLIYL